MVEIDDNEFEQLSKYIKSHYGINLKTEKKYLVVGRLQQVLQEKGFVSFSQYYKHITHDLSGEAVRTLLSKITTNHTFFMREFEHFAYFRDTVLPWMASKEKASRDLRIWSAGCSTGEEPYTLAMILHDHFGPDKKNWDSRILATDISPAVIETATKGMYTSDQLNSVPEMWKKIYFRRLQEDTWTVADNIKSEVIFRKFNLMNRQFPFKKKFHVIFCRNVMIYFDQETKDELVNRYYESIEPGGYLFIGHSETINRNDSKFKYIKPAIYRKE
ncbi:MAG: CheR family methyltransferase [Candidatus Saccharibacteria bacterium]